MIFWRFTERDQEAACLTPLQIDRDPNQRQRAHQQLAIGAMLHLDADDPSPVLQAKAIEERGPLAAGDFAIGHRGVYTP